MRVARATSGGASVVAARGQSSGGGARWRRACRQQRECCWPHHQGCPMPSRRRRSHCSRGRGAWRASTSSIERREHRAGARAEVAAVGEHLVARDAELREQLLEPGGSERRELRCALELVLGKRRLVRQNLLAALEEQVVHRARRHRVRHRRLCLRKVRGELPLELGRERFQPASALRARPLGNVAPAHGIRHLGPRNHKQQRRAGNAPRHGLHTEFLGHESYCSLSSTVAALTRKVAYCTL